MALFSRRPKKPSAPESEESAEPSREERRVEAPSEPGAAEGESSAVAAAGLTRPEAAIAAEAATHTPADAAAPEAESAAGPTRPKAATDEPAASVSISVSAFGGLGAALRPAPPASTAAAPGPAAAAPVPGGAAPAPGAPVAPAVRPRPGARTATEFAPPATETLAGLRDNVLLRQALAGMTEGPQAQALLDVTRQLLQGHVFLRVKGDARALLAEGKPLPLGIVKAGDRTFALVYSSGAALQESLKADADTETSAMGQPVLAVLRHVLAGSFDGIILDHASAPARAVLPRELLQKVVEQTDPQLTVKNLLAGERTPITPTEVAEALTRVPVWVAVGRAEGGKPGLAEGRLADGSRYLEVYSHPLEVAVMGRGDNAGPLTAPQLSKALAADAGLSGVIVNPAGPWIRLTRDDLGPVLAL